MVKCNNCNWEGSNFVDHIEGSKLACPKCGFTRRDRNFIYYLYDTFPAKQYLNSSCLEVTLGTTSDILSTKFPQTITINIRPSGGEIYGNLERLVYKDNMFDFIVCLDVIEHVENDKQTFSELFRLLKPQGRLMLHTPLWSEKGPASLPREIHSPEYHMSGSGQLDAWVYRYYSSEALIRLLKTASFRVKEIRFLEHDLVLHQDIFYECHKD